MCNFCILEISEFLRKLKLLLSNDKNLFNMEHKSKEFVGPENDHIVFESTHQLHVIVVSKIYSLNQKQEL